MTAAVLQFNQHIRQTHTQHQSESNNNTDYIDTPMTKEYHQIMIDLLNTEHPFRAVRLALSFNCENGFELIPVGMIRKWKRESLNQNRQNDNSQIKIEKTKIPRLNCENRQNENSENKMLQLETGYRELLAFEK